MSLGEDREVNKDILSIGRAVAAFFESRENPGHGHELGQLCERLAIRTAEGTNQLVPEEYEDLFPDPSVFSAVGKPADFSPLILTVKKKLYFQKYFEYERMFADALSFRAKKPVRKISSEVKEYFDGYVRQFLDPGQALWLESLYNVPYLCSPVVLAPGKPAHLPTFLPAYLDRTLICGWLCVLLLARRRTVCNDLFYRQSIRVSCRQTPGKP